MTTDTLRNLTSLDGRSVFGRVLVGIDGSPVVREPRWESAKEASDGSGD